MKKSQSTQKNCTKIEKEDNSGMEKLFKIK